MTTQSPTDSGGEMMRDMRSTDETPFLATLLLAILRLAVTLPVFYFVYLEISRGEPSALNIIGYAIFLLVAQASVYTYRKPFIALAKRLKK